MSNITSLLSNSGISPRQNNQAGSQAAAYVKEQSLRYQENLDTNLVLETKEGDKVTLSANTYTDLNTFTYNSEGVIQSEFGTAAYSMSQQEITLASGQSFSFTVEGDLNDQELADIESMLKGLDTVIVEMKQGDMDGAVEQALKLGGYDTVSSFSADISYQQYFEATSAVSAMASQTLPAEDSDPQLTPGQDSSHGNKLGHLLNFDKFLNKLIEKLDGYGDKEVGLAQKPINKLFNHHLDELRESGEYPESIYQALETAMKEVESLINERVNGIFDKQLADVADTQAE